MENTIMVYGGGGEFPKRKEYEVFYIECDCGSQEHSIRFIIFSNDEYLVVWTFLLSRIGFFKRFWNALKYIFSYRRRYGHFEETLLNPAQVEQLRDLLNQAL